MIGGVDIQVVPSPKREKRSWRERLFTRPWRPMTNHVITSHPMTDLVKDGELYHCGGTVWMSEPQFEELVKSMNNSSCRIKNITGME